MRMGPKSGLVVKYFVEHCEDGVCSGVILTEGYTLFSSIVPTFY